MRLAWLGHLFRMDQGQMVKQLFDGKLGGRTDRPRLRWLDDAEADLRTLDIDRWRLIAKDSMEWVGILRGKSPVRTVKPESSNVPGHLFFLFIHSTG
jgi:hypothetical protein